MEQPLLVSQLGFRVMLTERYLRGTLCYRLRVYWFVELTRVIVDCAGEVNESGGVLTFFIPAKLE